MTTTLKALTGRTGLRDKQIAAHLQVIKRFRDFNDLDGLLKLQAMWERTGEHTEEVSAIHKALTIVNARAWAGEAPLVNDTILQMEAEAVAKAVRRLFGAKQH